MSSCSLFDSDLDNTYDESRLLNDPSFAEGLLLNAYRSIPTGYSFEEVATDDAVSNDKSNVYLNMATGSWTSSNNPISTWNDSYSVISYLNKFLSIVDDVEWSWQSADRNNYFKSRYKGEAYAMRALYHFNILKAHAGPDNSNNLLGIPYIESIPKAEDENEWNLSRPSYNETVEKILNDLDRAISLLPEVYADEKDNDDYNKVNGANHVNRISGLIARALKARIALHAASPAFHNGSYDKDLCMKAADEAAYLIDKLGGIDAINKTIKDPYFYDANSDTKNQDILWRMDYQKNVYSLESNNYPPSLYGNGRVNPTQNFVEVFPMKNGYPISYDDKTLSGYNEDDPYSNRDPRLANFVLCNGGKIGSYQIYTDEDPQNPNGLETQTNSTRTGYYLKKLLRPDVTLTPSAITGQTHVRPLIRYTEIYFIYAEAANELYGMDNDPDGHGYTPFTIIANIRKRAKITSKGNSDAYMNNITQEEFTKLLRDERRIELSFEGFRFWDIRRWGLPLDEPAKGIRIVETDEGYKYNIIPIVERRSYQPYMQYGPIPLDQTLKCPSLVQNQGW